MLRRYRPVLHLETHNLGKAVMGAHLIETILCIALDGEDEDSVPEWTRRNCVDEQSCRVIIVRHRRLRSLHAKWHDAEGAEVIVLNA